MGYCVTSFTSKTSVTGSSASIREAELDLVKEQERYKKQEYKLLRLPNVSAYSNMAPALTEPLSQTSKLSSSATSASPRPISSSLLINNNHSIENNNTSREGIFLEASRLSSTGKKIVRDINRKGTFQLAFERVVARQAAAAATVARQYVKELRVTTSSNGTEVNCQMSPMCDNTSKGADLNLDKEIYSQKTGKVQIKEEQTEAAEEEEDNSKEGEKTEEQIKLDQQHMDLSSCDLQESHQKIDEASNAPEKSVATSATSENSNNSNDVDNTVVIIEKDSKKEDESPIKEQCDKECIETHEEEEVVLREEQEVVVQLTEEVGTEAPGDQSSSEAPVTTSSPQHQQQQQQQHQEQQPKEQEQQQQQNVSQTQTTSVPSLTPQSTTSGMGLQKDFIKDSAEMDQVLGDMDLLQVLKGFDTNPGGETLCDLAGNLVFFNDVDVMNYEEMGTAAKDSETREIRSEIEKRQQQMQRKCDFLLRRLRKIQSRYMGKHASEEIAGLFEWTNRIVRRKYLEHNRQLSYDEDKHRTVSTASMRSFLRRIDTVATAQHSNPNKYNKIMRASGLSGPENSKLSVAPIIPQFDPKVTEEIGHVSGMLQTELKQVQSSLDSDVTASSSGGESADEMVTYNNQMQQSLSIAKRAAWRFARDRAAIASRWTWLLAQISDLEYRIKQHNELYNQIKRSKGSVSANSDGCSISQTLPSVNGYRGVLPGNSKTIDTDSIPPNGAYDSSSILLNSSCRTRPFQRVGFRKRKLLQTANVHTISKKAARPSTVKCGCQWPLHPCALCTGRPDPTAPRDLPDTMTASERVALLDSGFHPVLSFPEDVSSSIHLEATVRLPEWQNRILRSSKSVLKGAMAAQRAAEREDRSKKYLDSRRKFNRKYSAQDIMAANKLKIAKNRRALHSGQYNNHLINVKPHRKLTSSNTSSVVSTGGTSGDCIGSSIDGRSVNIGNGGMITGSTSFVLSSSCGNGGLSSNGFADSASGPANNYSNDNFDSTNGLLPRSKNSSPTPGSHGSSSYKVERMDRRNRNSYDIDNIVIPYSVAASTRVEILPYKEIPTPKWRVVQDEFEDEKNPKEISKTSGIFYIKAENRDNQNEIKDVDSSPNPNKDSDFEDISDEAISIRHERALQEERKKFQTYLKFPWSTRSRANRRLDSRAESSGANTPDPTSPLPNTSSVGSEQESISFPTATSFASQASTLLENINGVDSSTPSNLNSLTVPNNSSFVNTCNTIAKRIERKRTVSMKKEREVKEEYRRSSTPDSKEVIPPFEPHQFPLSDELYEAMLQMMPNDHQLMEDCLKTNVCDGNSIDPADKNSGASYSCKQGSEHTGQLNASSTISGNPSVNESDALLCDLTTFETPDSLIGEDSDTDSAESGMQDEDPNDPEWREPA